MNSENLILIDPKGKARRASVETLEPLGKTNYGGSGEGQSHLVSVLYDGNEERTIRVRKTITGKGVTEGPFEIKFDPRSVMQKWKDLAIAGVSVDDYIEVSEDNTTIVLPELSQGGQRDFIDFEELIRRRAAAPAWMIDSRKIIFTSLIRNFTLASEHGYTVLPDGWFVVHDKNTGEIKVILRDLGQGVMKETRPRSDFFDIKASIVKNIMWPLGERTGIYQEQEWATDFPELLIKK